MVVAESDGQIRVIHIASRSVRSVGEGMAPRLIPFSNEFVFLREQSSTTDRITQVRTITYELFKGSFIVPTVEPVGPLVAVAQASVNGGASPVSWMVVGDAGEGFVLSGHQLCAISAAEARAESRSSRQGAVGDSAESVHRGMHHRTESRFTAEASGTVNWL